ncbi:MAG: aryl-alcohol dehydrogenase [Nevskiaceae bacterium]|nr:MAG: aryl-alcohol dehydrogenase [Nevskiaceae bacterium]
MTKIALGTTQFGLNYGITNRKGQLSASEIVDILSYAERAGIRAIDTAAAYGGAEAALGQHLARGHRYRIVTKLPGLPNGITPAQVPAWLRRAFDESLARLHAQEIYGLLMHSVTDLLHPELGRAVWKEMLALREAGLVKKIGASVYGQIEIDYLLEHLPLDLIQLPISILDQRPLDNGALKKLKASGVEIHARSLLLQGVLALRPDQLPKHLAKLAPTLRNFHTALQSTGLSAVQAAVAFANAVPEIDQAVFGVTSVAELAEITNAAKSVKLPLAWFKDFSVHDEKLINPSQWRHQEELF